MNKKNQEMINKIKNVTETLGASLPDLMVVCLFLTFEFIVLKMVDLLAWSWLWVFSPAWGFAVFSIVLLVAANILKNKQAS